METITVSRLVKKFRSFYGNQMFITVYTRTRHWSLSWARWIQSTPSHPISPRSILILSSHIRLGIPSGLFVSGFPTKIFYPFQKSSIRAAFLAHLILLDFIIVIIPGKAYKLWRSSQCNLIHPTTGR